MGTSNSMVAHKWAHGQAGKGSNFQTDGSELYSYSTLVGFNTGRGLVFISESSMTPSTSKQLCYARCAVSHLDVIYSPVFHYGRGSWGAFDEQGAYTLACEAVNETIKGYTGARLSKYLHSSMVRASDYALELKEIGKRYKFKAFRFSAMPAGKLDAARVYAEEYAVKDEARRAAARVREVARLGQQRLLDANDFDAWRSGSGTRCPASYRYDAAGGYYIAVHGDKVVTSGGAECPIAHARIGLAFWLSRKHTGIEPACIFEPWQKNGHSVKLGVFQLDRIDAQGNAYAGCHKFTAEELNRLYHLIV